MATERLLREVSFFRRRFRARKSVSLVSFFPLFACSHHTHPSYSSPRAWLPPASKPFYQSAYENRSVDEQTSENDRRASFCTGPDLLLTSHSPHAQTHRPAATSPLSFLIKPPLLLHPPNQPFPTARRPWWHCRVAHAKLLPSTYDHPLFCVPLPPSGHWGRTSVAPPRSSLRHRLVLRLRHRELIHTTRQYFIAQEQDTRRYF